MGILAEAQQAALKAEAEILPINSPAQQEALPNSQTTLKQGPSRANNYKYEIK